MIRILGVSLLMVCLPGTTVAQADAGPARRLAVFLDCHAGCDFDLIREQISYVDWMRDRTAVDVHLLITSLDAGAGGSEYTLAFLGQRALSARTDTLRFTTTPVTTNDERRRALVRTIAAGLASFMVRSGNGDLIQVTAAARGEDELARPSQSSDPWKAWVFEIGLEGGLSGEANYKSRNLTGSFEARRVTEAWKFNFEFDYEYEDDHVTDQEFDELGNVIAEQTFRNLQRSYSAEHLLVKSISNHASAGLLGTLRSNTYRNLRRGIEVGPAVEYNILPYSQSTRHELVLRYAVGYAHNRYVDLTIFDKMRETLPLHVLVLNYRTQATWGSMNFRTEHRNYLSDAAKRNTNVNGSFNVRLFRGLQVGVHGGYSWIRDQIALRKGSSDQVDVLLRRRELLTGYDYRAGIGLSYTFGSIFNNVVNPRF
ncbi:MAG TPA: DUF481 domain-containing protein [Longimicrobiales bacterium]|nr:DUF481 domain-containing protein [Longimicrobiales bacterium]